MEYNDLLNELFNLLDKDENIIKIKELKNKLLNNKELLKEIEDVNNNFILENKKKLYKNKDYVEYLKLETNIRLLIYSIKNKFNFIGRSCK